MVFLSVVAPVRNEGRFIAATLEALAGQEYPRQRFEIIVVDGGSEDGTREETARFGREHPDVGLRLLDNPGRLSSRGRNIGVKAARGRLVAVIDGHVHIPGRRLFADMEKAVNEHGALCLARPAPLDVPGVEGLPYWIAAARKSWIGHSRSSYIYSDFRGWVDPVSSGFAYERSVFERVGGFDESFDAAEDVEFHHRLKLAGIMAWTAPEFTIYSYPRESFAGLFRQQVRYGEGRARFVRKHRGGLTWETPLPAFLLLLFAGLPWALLLPWPGPAGRLAVVSPLAAYAAVVLAAGMQQALAKGRFWPGFLVALAVWTTHMGLGWGFLKTMFIMDRHR